MVIQGFNLVNEAKLRRAKEGSMSRGGTLKGGVAELVRAKKLKAEGEEMSKEEQTAREMALICEYDKIGGLIMKNGLKVQSGSFWNIARKQQRVEPEVSFEMKLDGELVEVTEGEAKAIEVAKKKVTKLKAKKKKKKAKLEDK